MYSSSNECLIMLNGKDIMCDNNMSCIILPGYGDREFIADALFVTY